MISIRGGKINANAELLNAPTKEITAPRLGIAAAKATKIKDDTFNGELN